MSPRSTWQGSDQVYGYLLPWPGDGGGVQETCGSYLGRFVREALGAPTYVTRDLAEHAGPIVKLRDTGNSFRDAEVPRGRLVVVSVQEFLAFPGRYALFPLRLRGRVSEV